jgi:hypothetical protein
MASPPIRESEVKTAHGVYRREFLVSGNMDWLKFYQFWYDGHQHEYIFPCGSGWLTPQQAHDVAVREQLRSTAHMKFLADVELETVH